MTMTTLRILRLASRSRSHCQAWGAAVDQRRGLRLAGPTWAKHCAAQHRLASSLPPTEDWRTVPNALTALRLVAVPGILATWYLELHGVSAALFGAAAATDWFDGFLARRWNQKTALGALLDPLADKLLVSSTLVILVEHAASPVVSLPAAAILARELGVSTLREWTQAHRPEAASSISVAWHGKAKAAAQLLALQGLLAGIALSDLEATEVDESQAWGPSLYKGSLLLLWLAAGLTLGSGFQQRGRSGFFPVQSGIRQHLPWSTLLDQCADAMEVRVEAADGLPADAVLSLRLGATRRQAPLQSALSHPLRFSTFLDSASEPLRLDVMRPMSTAQIVLRAEEHRYTVPLAGCPEAAIQFSVKPSFAKAAERGRAPDAYSAPTLPGFKDAAASAKEYLERHHLLQYMQSLLHAVIQAKPKDPVAYMMSLMKTSQTRSESRRSSEEVPEARSDPGPRAASKEVLIGQAASDPGIGPEAVEATQAEPCAPTQHASCGSGTLCGTTYEDQHASAHKEDFVFDSSVRTPTLEKQQVDIEDSPASASKPLAVTRVALDPQRLKEIRASLQRQLRNTISEGKLEMSVQKALELMTGPSFEAEEHLRNELIILLSERKELTSRTHRLTEELHQLRQLNQDLHLKLSKSSDHG
ncbi:pgsA [Symbiodinium sp. CCMP2592]|nr:pgsA [Symbiodinium sp. CCMP2592]